MVAECTRHNLSFGTDLAGPHCKGTLLGNPQIAVSFVVGEQVFATVHILDPRRDPQADADGGGQVIFNRGNCNGTVETSVDAAAGIFVL